MPLCVHLESAIAVSAFYTPVNVFFFEFMDFNVFLEAITHVLPSFPYAALFCRTIVRTHAARSQIILRLNMFSSSCLHFRGTGRTADRRPDKTTDICLSVCLSLSTLCLPACLPFSSIRHTSARKYYSDTVAELGRLKRVGGRVAYPTFSSLLSP